jgi:SAM-dependent methyltransferase
VLSVFDHDTAGMVRTRIAAASAAVPAGRAADLGCGTGKFTPLLARAFARVQACDRSARGLQETRVRCQAQNNIDFWHFDLACDPAPFAPVEFVLCVNVTNQVAHDGTLLLVVPSLESVQLGYFAAFEACLHDGISCAESLRRSAPGDDAVLDLHQGVHRLDGLRTKHYLREELQRMLPAHEFDVTEIVKLEYPADAASASWDWLVCARRR